jgi:hypothetical protein
LATVAKNSLFFMVFSDLAAGLSSDRCNGIRVSIDADGRGHIGGRRQWVGRSWAAMVVGGRGKVFMLTTCRGEALRNGAHMLAALIYVRET